MIRCGGMKRICGAVAILVALAATSAPAALVEPPFFGDAKGFIGEVDGGQFSALLDVHLFQYAADPAWAALWAADRYQSTGVLAGYGSTSSRRMRAVLDLRLNFQANDRLLLRYDQRRWTDDRFALGEERFDALWWATKNTALMVSGWPTPHKDESSAGIGCYLGKISGGNQLTLMVRDDRMVFNSKTTSGLRYTRQPYSILSDGSGEFGAWTVYGSLNLGTPFTVEQRTGNTVTRTANARLSHGYGGVLWRRDDLAAGVRGRFTSLRREEEDSGGGVRSLALDRDWWLAEAHVEFGRKTWGWALRTGYAWQRDEFFLAGDLDGDYRMGNWMFGVDGIYRGWDPAEVRFGYLGSVYHMDRQVTALGDAPPTLENDAESGYTDKVHLKGRYRFLPTLFVELLISKEIKRRSFGGFAVNVIGLL